MRTKVKVNGQLGERDRAQTLQKQHLRLVERASTYCAGAAERGRYVPPVPAPCPFCEFDPARLLRRHALTATLRDGYPVTAGHSLVVPIRHVASLFDLPAVELRAVWEAVATLRHELALELGVTAFNVGLNDGADAGQTVPHAHVHVIPRRPGDVADPRGGVRWVVPDRAAWWRTE